MPIPAPVTRSGLAAVETGTALLQRIRGADPVAGLFEAAELQWWWAKERSTDTVDQLFWFDEQGPVAAAILTDWGSGDSMLYSDPTLLVATLPGMPLEDVAAALDAGRAHAAALGIASVSLEADRDDAAMQAVLPECGFERVEDALLQCWLDLGDRPDVSMLEDGYELRDRVGAAGTAHHLAKPGRGDVDARLRQGSLYRDDLDLFVVAPDGEVAGFALCWFDPVTATAVIEPVRTRDAHQRRGISRHLLTAGLDRVARLGATRAAIGYEPDNPASGPLYRSLGFVPHRRTDLLSGPTS